MGGKNAVVKDLADTLKELLNGSKSNGQNGINVQNGANEKFGANDENEENGQKETLHGINDFVVKLLTNKMIKEEDKNIILSALYAGGGKANSVRFNILESMQQKKSIFEIVYICLGILR